MSNIDQSVKFKKFWVVSVNNCICDASYDGKGLKADHPIPSFRKFYFIKSWEDLIGFRVRDEISNRDLCESYLSQRQAVLEQAQ
jgi:hypothetical protein